MMCMCGGIERRCGISGRQLSAMREVRKAARAAYEAGDVILFQRRNGKGFDYIAQRRETSPG